MAVPSTASCGPRTQALGGPKAPVHKIGGGRRSGRLGEPPGASESLAAICNSGTHIVCGFPPTRRIAQAISMGHYQRSLVLLGEGDLYPLAGPWQEAGL